MNLNERMIIPYYKTPFCEILHVTPPLVSLNYKLLQPVHRILVIEIRNTLTHASGLSFPFSIAMVTRIHEFIAMRDRCIVQYIVRVKMFYWRFTKSWRGLVWVS